MTDEGEITIPEGSEKGTVTFKVKITIKDSTTHQYSNTISFSVGCTSSNVWVWASDMTLLKEYFIGNSDIDFTLVAPTPLYTKCPIVAQRIKSPIPSEIDALASGTGITVDSGNWVIKLTDPTKAQEVTFEIEVDFEGFTNYAGGGHPKLFTYKMLCNLGSVTQV